MITTISFLDEDFVVEFSYKIFAKGHPGKLFGPPEDCFPPEPMEYETEVEGLWIDTGKRYRDGERLVTTDWLRGLIQNRLENDPDIARQIEEEEGQQDYE